MDARTGKYLALGWLVWISACATPPSRPPIRAHELPTPAAWVVTDRTGVCHDLDADLAAGRPVALIFWQTWCASCLRETPVLASASRAFGDRIRFFGVIPGPDAVVDESEITRTVDSFDIPYPQLRDRDLSLTRLFDVQGTPTILVLGPDKRVLYRGHAPPEDWASLTQAQ